MRLFDIQWMDRVFFSFILPLVPERFPLTTSTTIANAWTPILYSATNGFEYPVGLAMYEYAMGENLLAVDSLKNQIVEIVDPNTATPNASVKIFTWAGDNELTTPLYLTIDPDHDNNLYVSDSMSARILLFYSIQSINPLPRVAAGTSGASGLSLDRLAVPGGVAIDSQENLYVSDTYNHRIMLWIANATTGILIAGTTSTGSDTWSLNYPMGLHLDKQNQRLYVADMNNHRIQVFHLAGSPPYEGMTVAGGFGSGTGNHQLNQPTDVWISKTTGMIFIADNANHRIQRWSQNATSGITIAGDPNGISGMIDGKLNSPNGLTINKHETQLYVSDSGNQRIQRFELV